MTRLLKSSKIYTICVSILLLAILLIACAPSAAPKTPTPAVAPKIKIGVIGPMNYLQGRESWDASTLAMEEINKAGGITVNGVKYEIELAKADSNEVASVPEAISAMERLLSVNKVKYVVGGYRSEAVLGQQDLLSDYKALYLNTGTSAGQTTQRVKENYDKYKYYFRANNANTALIGPLIYEMLEVPMNAVRKQLGIEKPKVAILAIKSLIADGVMPIIKSFTSKLGGELVGEWRMALTADTLAAELNAINDAGAHVIYFQSDGPSGVVGNKEWGTLKIPAALTGWNSEAQQQSHWDTTNGKCEYAMTGAFNARVAVTPLTLPFWDAYTKRFNGNWPSTYSSTHSAIYVLKAAIEKANSLDPDVLIPVLEKTDMDTSYFRQAFYPMDQKYPHDTIIAPSYAQTFLVQWKNRQMNVVWPDGNPVAIWPKPDEYKGLRYAGTVDYELPPWMIEKYKGSTK